MGKHREFVDFRGICLGSGPIHVRGSIWFRLHKETGMSDLFWLTDEQMVRLRPFFP